MQLKSFQIRMKEMHLLISTTVLFALISTCIASLKVGERIADDNYYFLSEKNGLFWPTAELSYHGREFDLTDASKIMDWDTFKSTYKHMKVNNLRIEFYRHDHEKGTTTRNNILDNFDLNNAVVIQDYGDMGKTEYYFNYYVFNANEIFDQSIKTSGGYHQSQIRCLVHVYNRKSDGHLMLRTLYRNKMDTAGATVGSSVRIYAGGYLEFF